MVRAVLVLAVLASLAVPASAAAVPSTDFGTVTAGTSGPTQTVTLTGPLTVGHLSIFGSAFVPVSPLSSCQGTIPAGGHCDLLLRFAPQVAGDYRGHLDADGTPVASLRGVGAVPGAPTGGIGTALVISKPAPTALPKAFTAHRRAHRATAKQMRKHRKHRRHHHK